MGKSYIAEVICKNCNVTFKKRIGGEKTSKRHYCSKDCRISDKDSYKSEWTPERRAQYSALNSGKNNPNYGNNWSADMKYKASIAKKIFFQENPDISYNCGKSNRGVKFSKERIAAMHSNRDSSSYSHSHTLESRKLIGGKSKEKWTDEYKANHRKKMEDLGHWIPLDDISPYKQYFKNANWIESMVGYFNETEMENFKLYGIFSAKKNPKGFVRDHIVPRKIGFEFGLPEYILRHPANLQFISHRENIIKGFSDRRLTQDDKTSIINQLLERIISYNRPWKEQNLCSTFINERRLF